MARATTELSFVVVTAFARRQDAGHAVGYCDDDDGLVMFVALGPRIFGAEFFFACIILYLS